MYTTITNRHKDFDNLIKIEFSKEFKDTFKNYDDIILVNGNREFKYKKFKEYYIRYFYCDNYLKNIEYLNYSGKKHREDGPARIEYYENGNIKYKFYYINGNRHKEDGPAVITYSKNGIIKCKEYYINGERHREDGPAYIFYEDGKILKEYYLNDEEYSYEDYLEELKCIQQ